MTAEVLTQVLHAETHEDTRKRRRRPTEAANHVNTNDAVLTSLLHAHRRGKDGITVSRRTGDRKASRYISAVEGSQLPKLLDVLEYPLNLVTQEKGYRSPFGSQRTIVRPTARLLSRFEGLHFSDLTRFAEGEELVLLKGERLTAALSELMEYEDTELTNLYRAQVKAINAHLAAADIDYLQDATADAFVDTSERHLKRRFTNADWFSGGRLWGGWWQSVGKADRLSNTLINGEPVVSLDFEAMGLMLAYAYVQTEPPAGELYPTRFHRGKPGDSEQMHLARATVKKLANACLFARKPLRQWPRGLLQACKGVAVGDAVDALKKAHPAIAPLFFTGIGHVLQHAESTILVDTLLALVKRGITALPVHDCIVVPESAADAANKEMAAAFTFHTRLPARIAVERAPEE
jgi:hypothetical protein